VSEELLQHAEFDAERLMREHPPIWQHPSKQWVFDIACLPGSTHTGLIGYTRWAPRALPRRVSWPPPQELVVPRPDYYDYQPVSDGGASMEWHVNFADPQLFVAYGSGLLAQDEIQVAEHPSLGALREALKARDCRALTKDESGPTPILITGVERRCRIAVEPNADEGRPLGLYGNRFAEASEAVVRKAVTRIDPPTITNFITIAAPYWGARFYAAPEIRYSLTAAFTGFHAAMEVTKSTSPAAETIIHSGFWGCGAFGGNRVLMTMIQLLAASAAGVRKLVYHTGDTAGLSVVEEAQEHLQEIFMTPTIAPNELIQHLVDRRYSWGESDGN